MYSWTRSLFPSLDENRPPVFSNNHSVTWSAQRRYRDSCGLFIVQVVLLKLYHKSDVLVARGRYALTVYRKKITIVPFTFVLNCFLREHIHRSIKVLAMRHVPVDESEMRDTTETRDEQRQRGQREGEGRASVPSREMHV